MNRAHNAEQALECIQLVKEAGFKNYSVDLIYGTPTLSDKEWEKNVQTIIDLDVPHISCYALTVEPNTALQKMITLHKKEAVDPEKQVSQFLLLSKWLHNAGYENKYRTNFLRFSTNSYRDYNLDLNINESPSEKILVLYFITYLPV